MIGRADKVLFITTGTFTRSIITEATRDGAPPIDLVDGDRLATKLKKLGLGIKKKWLKRFGLMNIGLKLCKDRKINHQSIYRHKVEEP